MFMNIYVCLYIYEKFFPEIARKGQNINHIKEFLKQLQNFFY